ncbi:MAG: helix-turn-helix transcriptional regulator [Lachnospiraceae bacterium]|nr:helix-turn-helix transcriptional regulator [Lachnospiraceae bacterium]
MDIGSKIKSARLEAELTQEQAAEALGVSRQTISNWENEKTYPDIVSVVKMSDLYHISLDHLLKEEEAMDEHGRYLDYLEESTDMVKSREKLGRILVATTYLGVWMIALIWKWVLLEPTDIMLYQLVVLWMWLPISTFVISGMIGKHDFWGMWKWIWVVFWGVWYWVVNYIFVYGEKLVAGGIRTDLIMRIPKTRLFWIGMMISALGMGIGVLARRLDIRKVKREVKREVQA